MLAWFGCDDSAPPGAADRILEELARDLAGRGIRLAGAVQRNLDLGPDCACDMEVLVIGDESRPIRISQSLGSGSSGCRLDTGALEMAVARVAPRVAGADLMILPKFGRQEAEGRGFRSLIAEAVAGGLPVLLHVPRQQRGAFAEFAEGMAVELPVEGLAGWCMAQLADS